MSTHQQFRSQVDSSTSAWFKSVIDPAHARDYGCAGMPDENKMPTLVCSNRYTFTVSTDTVPTGIWYNVNNAGNLTVESAPSVSAITVISGASPYGVVVLYYGTYENQPVCAPVWLTMPGFEGVINGAGHANASAVTQPQRFIGGSLTADIVGQLMYTGGYFETGYLRPSMGVNGSRDGFLHYMDAESQWATRTCNYKDGCYTVHRMNNYDYARVWRNNAVDNPITLQGTGGGAKQTTVNLPNLANPGVGLASGYDPIFVKYYVSGSTAWVLRVTYNCQYEVQMPYAQGGTDGARYDRAAVEAYLSMADVVDFCYPSSYNDLKQLLGSIRRTLVKHKAPLQKAIGLLPYGGAINAAMDLLLDTPKAAKRRVKRQKQSQSKAQKRAGIGTSPTRRQRRARNEVAYL